jgi:Cu/Zn superoxide dismutase
MKTGAYVLIAMLAVIAAASAGASPTAELSSTKTTKLTAFLTVNQSIPMPKGAHGSGKFTATVTGTKITWRMTFKGMTGAVSAAHIHSALAGKANPKPAVSLCGPCTSGEGGTASVSAAILKKILGGATYVNLHTAKNAGGEIRGQIASS